MDSKLIRKVEIENILSDVYKICIGMIEEGSEARGMELIQIVMSALDRGHFREVAAATEEGNQ